MTNPLPIFSGQTATVPAFPSGGTDAGAGLTQCDMHDDESH